MFPIEPLQNESMIESQKDLYGPPNAVNGTGITSACPWRMSQGERITKQTVSEIMGLPLRMLPFLIISKRIVG